MLSFMRTSAGLHFTFLYFDEKAGNDAAMVPQLVTIVISLRADGDVDKANVEHMVNSGVVVTS